MSENKQKEFGPGIPEAAILKRPERTLFEEEIPINVEPSPELFSEQRTPTIREMGLQGDILILKSLLEPFKELVEKYLSKEIKTAPLLMIGEEILLTVGDLQKIAAAYKRVENLGRSIEWLEARINSGTDSRFERPK